MPRLALFALVLSSTLCACEAEPMQEDFFRIFGRDGARAQMGTSQVVKPAATGSGIRGEYVKFLKLNTQDGAAVMVNFSLRAENSQIQPDISQVVNPATGAVVPAAAANLGAIQIGGPLVARLRWGVGGAYNVVEFDIPSPRLNNLFVVPGQDPVDDIGDGVNVCVSGSSFELLVRNDASLAPVTVQAGGGNQISINSFPARVLASISPGSGSAIGPLRRTIFVANAAATLAAGATARFNIPMFATRVWFFRTPSATTPLQIVTSSDQTVTARDVTISVNSEGPIELSPIESIMAITNLGAVAATGIDAVFEVQPN